MSLTEEKPQTQAERQEPEQRLIEARRPDGRPAPTPTS